MTHIETLPVIFPVVTLAGGVISANTSIVFLSSTLPTASVLYDPAGSPTVPLPGHSFPLAATTEISRPYNIASIKCSNALSPLVFPPPKL